ncbi:MAG TPA: peptide chain release factor N(5)-glutamine methyltransferase [Gammaproteobacteria bacterium]|nr:peptide chain release factor N(5)-glutamine methyltransferase [Gammaproteobacteria bacterium]
MILSEALRVSIQSLSSSETAKLDAEILLSFVLNCSRAYIISHNERALTSNEIEQYQQLIARRKQGEPIAYLIGSKEFWSLKLAVTPDTLIPRPETELLVELILKQFSENNYCRIADLGTGSGAIALAIAQEKPQWEIIATDQSAAALQVAKKNAAALKLKNVKFFQGDWCSALPNNLLFDVIVSNPPYIAKEEWQDLAVELAFEPLSALIADNNGLEDIFHIIHSAKSYLGPGGWLWLEHGFAQAENIQIFFTKSGYTQVNTYYDLAGKERVTCGKRL